MKQINKWLQQLSSFLSSIRCVPTMRFFARWLHFFMSLIASRVVLVSTSFCCEILSHVFHSCHRLSFSTSCSLHVGNIMLMSIVVHFYCMIKPCQSSSSSDPVDLLLLSFDLSVAVVAADAIRLSRNSISLAILYANKEYAYSVALLLHQGVVLALPE